MAWPFAHLINIFLFFLSLSLRHIMSQGPATLFLNPLLYSKIQVEKGISLTSHEVRVQ